MSQREAEKWYQKLQDIDGILTDISGVLYDAGSQGGNSGKAIPGSVQAVERLRSAGIPLRFCTNETQYNRADVAAKLNYIGYSILAEEVVSPVAATCSFLKQHGLRPQLLVYPAVEKDFAELDQSSPSCVVLGDASHGFSYTNLNKVFQLLMSLKNPVLISMGRGKYYKEGDNLTLDVGPYMKALEYACGVQAEIIGKPAPTFFKEALDNLGVTAERALMIGDDIENDVGGAQACGMVGIQVRTGKYRPSDEPHPIVTPDGYVDDFAQFVDIFLENKFC